MNRFDEYVASPYISQYIPIPFEQIMQVGERYNEQRKQAEENLATNIKKFGEFRSDSQADTENYYRETIGKMSPLLQEISSNPEALKDVAFRGKINSLINSVDYNKLSRYKQTAENLSTYNKVKAEMKAKGLINEEWLDPRMANWNTDSEGVMTDLAPIQYKSLQELSRPYVEDIKPTFYKGKAPISGAKMAYTNWMAVTPQERYKELNAHFSDIMSTPQGQKWYENIANKTKAVNPNATKEDIDKQFMNSLMTVTSWKDNESPVVDTASLERDIANIRNNGSGNNNPTIPPITPEAQMFNDQLAQAGQLVNNSTSKEVQNRIKNRQHDLAQTVRSVIKGNKGAVELYKSLLDTYKSINGVENMSDTDKHKEYENFNRTFLQILSQNTDNNSDAINRSLFKYSSKKSSLPIIAAMEDAFNSNETLKNITDELKKSENLKGAISVTQRSKKAGAITSMFNHAFDALSVPSPTFSTEQVDKAYKVGSNLIDKKLINPQKLLTSNPEVRVYLKNQGLNPDRPIDINSGVIFRRNTPFDLQDEISKGRFPSAILNSVDGFYYHVSALGDPRGERIANVTVKIPKSEVADRYDATWNKDLTNKDFDNLGIKYDDDYVYVQMGIIDKITEQDARSFNTVMGRNSGSQEAVNQMGMKADIDQSVLGNRNFDASDKTK